MAHKIIFLPLDERPCNALYPRYLAPIAGIELLMPPADVLPHYRNPGNAEALADWFLQHVEQVDTAVVSADLLGYGGLIPSRIGYEPTDEVLGRLEVLREARRRRPDLYLTAFNIIMRTANYNIATEEPDYWSVWGTRIWRTSWLTDRVERLNLPEEVAELEALRAEIPEEFLSDYLTRRSRNHTVNRHLIEMVADHTLDFLFLSQDDAAEYGLPAKEQRDLRRFIRELNVGDKAVVYPGADEVGSVLLARCACHLYRYTPTFFPRWASTDGPRIVADFEDRPLDQTVRGEIYCAGGVVTDSPQAADCVLFVNTPGQKQSYPPYAETATTVETPSRNLPDFLAALRYYASQRQVAVADVAYCNGADPALVPLLPRFIDYPQLAAYAGWNTAANTIGTTVAHAAMRLLGLNHGEGDQLAREAAHQTFLFHRVLEDWGYQSVIRTHVEAKLDEEGQHDKYRLNDGVGEVLEHVARHVNRLGEETFEKWFAHRGSSPNPRVRPEGWELKSISLPWGRTFEIGLELCVGVEATGGAEHEATD